MRQFHVDRVSVKIPMTIGHEYSGVIDAIGEGVTDWALGDKVVSMVAERIELEPYCSAVLELEDWDKTFSMAESKETTRSCSNSPRRVRGA